MRGLSAGTALCVTLAIPAAACAQGEASRDAPAVESYRLTVPVLRKGLPALYQSLAEITAKLEDPACPVEGGTTDRAGASRLDLAAVGKL